MSTTIKEKAKALINEISINAYQASSRLLSSDYMRTAGSLDLIIKISKEAKKVVEKINKPKKNKKSKTVSGIRKVKKRVTKKKVAKKKTVKRKVKRAITRKRRK